MRTCVLIVVLGSGCSFITDFSPPGSGGAGGQAGQGGQGGQAGVSGAGGTGGGGTGGSGGTSCGTGQKMCGAGCVATTNPAFGCAQQSCAPCPGAQNAVPSCTDGGAC